jgi:hypothetical protein
MIERTSPFSCSLRLPAKKKQPGMVRAPATAGPWRHPFAVPEPQHVCTIGRSGALRERTPEVPHALR